MSDRDAERPKLRHSGEMYDAIWSLPAAELVVEGVKPATVRHVLMAAARRTSPNRHGGEFIWWAAVETIARDAEVTARSVQRVFSWCLERGWLEVTEPGVRNGRARSGQERRQGMRAPTYRACLERWPADPARGLKNSRDVHVVTNEATVLVATGNGIAATPASPPIDSNDAGVVTNGVSRDVRVTQTRNSGKPGTPALNPEGEPAAAAAARARATAAEDEDDDDEEERRRRTLNGHQVALPLTGAVALSPPGEPGAGGIDLAVGEVNLERGAGTRSCPDCGAAVNVSGQGHQRSCRVYGRGSQIQSCPRCHEWVAEQGASKWHVIVCPLREYGPSQWAEVLAAELQKISADMAAEEQANAEAFEVTASRMATG